MVGVMVLMADFAAAQPVVEVRRDDNGVGELGLSWRKDGPLNPSADGRIRAELHPRVTAITPCSPAHLAGLEVGDILLRVDGRDTREGAPFPHAAPGTRYTIEFRRDGETRKVELVVGPQRPDPPQPVERRPVGPPSDWGCESEP